MMWKWLDQNAQPIQAMAAIITVLAALTAVIVVPIQINAADRIQREQTAREIYREFLSLTANKPEIATANYCALKDDKERIAYESYVEYLLYTAEQMVDTDETWREPMGSYLADHMQFICSMEEDVAYSNPVKAIIEDLRKDCTPALTCSQ